ncbi:unnamed protein product [Rangifer tarandus platyrhynchus]|uniref:Uncharacterized protein n=1 Tax=Rangifer tarandus platyrhynchus TaxID=3082113 RepID=A0AC59ZWX4_RANTA
MSKAYLFTRLAHSTYNQTINSCTFLNIPSLLGHPCFLSHSKCLLLPHYLHLHSSSTFITCSDSNSVPSPPTSRNYKISFPQTCYRTFLLQPTTWGSYLLP